MSYKREQAAEFAARVKGLGFTVYMAKNKTYGFITDAARERVLSFSVEDGGKLSGNYSPPSTQSGTGWRICEGLHGLKTAADVHAALYAQPPSFCGNRWKRFTTVKEYLDRYQDSSEFSVLE